jgi:hypothetical protein
MFSCSSAMTLPQRFWLLRENDYSRTYFAFCWYGLLVDNDVVSLNFIEVKTPVKLKHLIMSQLWMLWDQRFL